MGKPAFIDGIVLNEQDVTDNFIEFLKKEEFPPTVVPITKYPPPHSLMMTC